MELIDLLLTQVRAEPNPEIEQAWDEEIARRLEDLRAGRAKTIPADKVFAEVRKTIARQNKKRA